MKVLVIGGTLFIGRLLVEELIKAGHDVTLLHRKPGHGFRRKLDNIVADRNDGQAMRQALEGRRFDIVYDNVYDWERGTTAAQVEATVRACGDRIGRYIFMSSVAAYGDGLNHYEGDALAPDDHPEAYVRNKAQTERMLFRLHQRTGFPVLTFRPPFVYGPGNPFYRESFFWDRLRADRPIIIPGDGHRLMQFVYVKDLVGGMVRALDAPGAVGEAFNVGNEKPLTQVEWVRVLGKAAGKKETLVRVPRERIQEAGGSAMFPPYYFGEYLDVPPITMNVSKARRVLGMRPTPIEEGFKETYRWYVRQKERPKPDFSLEDRLLESAIVSRAGD